MRVDLGLAVKVVQDVGGAIGRQLKKPADDFSRAVRCIVRDFLVMGDDACKAIAGALGFSGKTVDDRSVRQVEQGSVLGSSGGGSRRKGLSKEDQQNLATTITNNMGGIFFGQGMLMDEELMSKLECTLQSSDKLPLGKEVTIHSVERAEETSPLRFVSMSERDKNGHLKMHQVPVTVVKQASDQAKVEYALLEHLERTERKRFFADGPALLVKPQTVVLLADLVTGLRRSQSAGSLADMADSPPENAVPMRRANSAPNLEKAERVADDFGGAGKVPRSVKQSGKDVQSGGGATSFSSPRMGNVSYIGESLKKSNKASTSATSKVPENMPELTLVGKRPAEVTGMRAYQHSQTEMNQCGVSAINGFFQAEVWSSGLAAKTVVESYLECLTPEQAEKLPGVFHPKIVQAMKKGTSVTISKAEFFGNCSQITSDLGDVMYPRLEASEYPEAWTLNQTQQNALYLKRNSVNEKKGQARENLQAGGLTREAHDRLQTELDKELATISGKLSTLRGQEPTLAPSVNQRKLENQWNAIFNYSYPGDKAAKKEQKITIEPWVLSAIFGGLNVDHLVRLTNELLGGKERGPLWGGYPQLVEYLSLDGKDSEKLIKLEKALNKDGCKVNHLICRSSSEKAQDSGHFFAVVRAGVGQPWLRLDGLSQNQSGVFNVEKSYVVVSNKLNLTLADWGVTGLICDANLVQAFRQEMGGVSQRGSK